MWLRLPFIEERDFCPERNAVFQFPEIVYGKREEEGKKLQTTQRIQRPTGIKRGIRKRGSEGDREIEKGIKASEEPQKEA